MDASTLAQLVGDMHVLALNNGEGTSRSLLIRLISSTFTTPPPPLKVAAAALLVYEILITLGQEITHVWWYVA